MKKGCLIFVLIYLGTAAAVSVGASLWDPTPPYVQYGQLSVMQVRLRASLAVGAITAIPLTLWIAGLLGVATSMKEWRLVADALSGCPPKEGRRIGAVGVLRGADSPLQAPLSGRQCLIYHYEILFPRASGKGGPNLCYWGYGLAPCRIDSVHGSVRLLAYAELDFPAEEQGPAGLPYAVRHVEATASTVIDVDVLRGKGLREVQQLFADDDGRIAADFRPGARLDDLEGCNLRERVVRDGDEVSAFGYYSAARGAFVPGSGLSDVFPIRLMKGTPAEIARHLRNNAIRSGAGALTFLALAVGVLVLVWVIARG